MENCLKINNINDTNYNELDIIKYLRKNNNNRINYNERKVNHNNRSNNNINEEKDNLKPRLSLSTPRIPKSLKFRNEAYLQDGA